MALAESGSSLVDTAMKSSSEDSNKVFIAAIVCSCIGSFGISMSLILMKIANIKVEYAKQRGKKFYCQKEWIAGLIVLVIASTFNYSKSNSIFWAAKTW